MSTYIMCAVCALIGFGVSYGLGYVVIPFLHKLKFGQTILDIGPKWHEKKQGTPTMGGVLFVVGTLVSFAVAVIANAVTGGKIMPASEIPALDGAMKVKLYAGLVMALAFGFIGFLDDYIKVVKKRNLGLTVIQKTVLQVVAMVGYLLTLYMNDPSGSTLIPFFGKVELKFFFWILGFAVIYCTTNAVNFTDGVDGLCASVTVTSALAFVAIAFICNFAGVGLLASCLAGSLGGYLIWNWHPAKVMMGDLGSMFLGGLVVAFAYAVDCPLIIILLGIIYVAEFASDIIQIGYFKLTHGKRIFKMAPIHHHFELCGWKETKVVKVFTLVNVLGCIAAVLVMLFGGLK